MSITIADAIRCDVHDAYAVTMTDGLRTTEVVMPGTQRAVWAHACRAGEMQGHGLAGYVPVDIRPASTAETACVRPVDSSYPAPSKVWSPVDQ